MPNRPFPREEEIPALLKEPVEIPHSKRKERQVGTNCEGFYLNYFRKDQPIKLFVKKSFLRSTPIDSLTEDYIKLKSAFGNIIPRQAFVPDEQGNIFVICVPIHIQMDVLNRENRAYFVELLKQSESLFKQLRFFTRKFEELAREGIVLDLYGEENLTVSNSNRLYFVDSFLVFCQGRMHLKEKSLENLRYLREIEYEVIFNNPDWEKEEES